MKTLKMTFKNNRVRWVLLLLVKTFLGKNSTWSYYTVDEKVYSKDNVWGYFKIFVIRQLIYGRCSISAYSWCRNHLLGIKLSIEKVVLGLDDDKNYIKTVYSSI